MSADRMRALREELLVACLRHERDVKRVRDETRGFQSKEFAMAVMYYCAIVLRLNGMSADDQMMLMGNIENMVYELPEAEFTIRHEEPKVVN